MTTHTMENRNFFAKTIDSLSVIEIAHKHIHALCVRVTVLDSRQTYLDR